MAHRASLRYIILAATEQDVNDCTCCRNCSVDERLQASFDLDPWQLMAAVRGDDERALTNQTIWVIRDAAPDSVHCLNGLDIRAIARALCQESQRRGLHQSVVK